MMLEYKCKDYKKGVIMKKLLIGTLATAVLATGLLATDKLKGEITYVQVRPDGDIAVKMLPTGTSTEIYAKIAMANGEKGKAMYAAALTALTTGKDVEIWKEGSYWDTIFLRK